MNVEYVVGRHAAALAEENWEAIARFVVHGQRPDEPLCGISTQPRHTAVVGLLGRFPPIVWLLLIALLAAVPLFLVYGYPAHHWREWLVTTLLIGYVASIWYVANRV